MAWNLVLVAAGFAVGGNVEKLVALFAQYNRIAFILLGVAVSALLIRFFLKRKAQAPS
mgnify:CR=1 FL=1